MTEFWGSLTSYTLVLERTWSGMWYLALKLQIATNLPSKHLEETTVAAVWPFNGESSGPYKRGPTPSVVND